MEQAALPVPFSSLPNTVGGWTFSFKTAENIHLLRLRLDHSVLLARRRLIDHGHVEPTPALPISSSMAHHTLLSSLVSAGRNSPMHHFFRLFSHPSPFSLLVIAFYFVVSYLV